MRETIAMPISWNSIQTLEGSESCKLGRQPRGKTVRYDANTPGDKWGLKKDDLNNIVFTWNMTRK